MSCFPAPGLCKGSIPLDERRPKSTLYENLLTQQRRRESAPVQCATFDPVVEEGSDPHNQDDGKKEAVMMRSTSRMSERKTKSDLDQNRNCAPTIQKGEDGGEHALDETEEWAKVCDNYCSLECEFKWSSLTLFV